MTAPTKSKATSDSPEAQHAAPASNDGKLVVRTSGFVARTDAKSNATTRYRRGQEFKPVEGVHDVDELIRARVIGRVGDPDAPTHAVKAIDVAHAQAEINQENSPVLDLTTQPFEQGPVEGGVGSSDSGSAGGTVTA